MKKTFTVVLAVFASTFSFGQISASENFEQVYNVWANPDSGRDRFVASEQYFCEGERAAGAMLGSILGQFGVGPKYMYSPFLGGNNGQDITISFSAIIGKANSTLSAMEAIPSGIDWGYFKVYYTIDQGENYIEIENLTADNFTSTTDCTTFNLTIPSAELIANTSFQLKFEVDRNTSYNELLMFIIDDVVIQQANLGTSNIASNSIKLYPNPVQSILNIESAGEVNKIEVINNLGMVVKKVDGQTAIRQLDVSNLVKGIYYIKVNEKETYQFIKK